MQKIMFNDKFGLTQAVLQGRKSQTRRFVPKNIVEGYHDLQIVDKECEEEGLAASGFNSFEEFCLYEMQFQRQCYKIGEEVAIAQRYADIAYYLTQDLLCSRNFKKGWKNKMFVKAEYMPHRIKITNVGIERLQDIYEEDCLKEGIQVTAHNKYVVNEIYLSKTEYLLKTFPTARRAFACLIDKISGKGTWESNPYVFVYDFELIK